MKFEIVRTLAEFENLSCEWNNLRESSPQRQNAFASYAWHEQVLRVYQPSYAANSEEFALVIGRRRGRAEVICPFLVKRRFGLTVVKWIGDPVSQYGDVIAKNGESTSHLIASALKFAIEQLNVDAFIFERVREDSAICDPISRMDPIELRSNHAPQIELQAFESFDALAKSISPGRRKKIRRAIRTLEKTAPLKFEVLKSSHEAQAHTKAVLELKQHSLTSRGIYSRAFADPGFIAFFESVAANTDDATGFKLSMLWHGNRLIASEIGFESHDTYTAHIGVFDDEFRKFGPGHLHMSFVLRHLIEGGITNYDFLPPSDEYKRSWSTHTIKVSDFAVPATSAGRLYCNAMKLKDPMTKVARSMVRPELLKIAVPK